jgi:hypothetical protein
MRHGSRLTFSNSQMSIGISPLPTSVPFSATILILQHTLFILYIRQSFKSGTICRAKYRTKSRVTKTNQFDSTNSCRCFITQLTKYTPGLEQEVFSNAMVFSKSSSTQEISNDPHFGGYSYSSALESSLFSNLERHQIYSLPEPSSW